MVYLDYNDLIFTTWCSIMQQQCMIWFWWIDLRKGPKILLAH